MFNLNSMRWKFMARKLVNSYCISKYNQVSQCWILNLILKFNLEIAKAFVGVKSPDQTMGLGPHIEFDHVRGEGVGTKRAPGPILMGPNLFKRQSEEKCLLRRAKYGSNMHPTSNKESLQLVLVVGMSPTSLWEGKEYRMLRERLQLPY